MHTVKVIAGDLTKGKWDFLPGKGILNRGSEGFTILPDYRKRESIKLGDLIETLESVTEQNKKKLIGAVVWEIVGTALMGPLGLVVGGMVGGNSKEVCFDSALTDGRKFLATTEAKT